MYAVIETGGKQHRVTPGQVIEVDRLPQAKGSEITLGRVLMVVDGEQVTPGTPVVAGVRVAATVRPFFDRVMSPAVSSTSRCFITAGSLIAKGRASALTAAPPSRSRRVRIARRVGSTSAANVRLSRSL